MIELDENFSIRCGKWQFTLVKHEKKVDENDETKEIMSKDLWFYPKLSMALEKYFNESIKVATNVQELIDEVKKSTDIIKSIK